MPCHSFPLVVQPQALKLFDQLKSVWVINLVHYNGVEFNHHRSGRSWTPSLLFGDQRKFFECHNAIQLGIHRVRTKSLGESLTLCVPHFCSYRLQHSGLGLFPNAQNIFIDGGTFVSLPVDGRWWFSNNWLYFIGQIFPANIGEARVKIPPRQKPNSSMFFTGRKDVLDRLGKIFVHCPNSKLMSRRSCLLWGMGGIGKTQICLKFTEEMSEW